MGDERMSNLVVCNLHPDLLDNVDLIKPCNEFVNETEWTNKRERLFGKFVPSGLDTPAAADVENTMPKCVNFLKENINDSANHKDDDDSQCSCSKWCVPA